MCGKMKEEFMKQREMDKRKYPMRHEECYQYKECPDCNGEGKIAESECCGNSIFHGICALCGENTEPTRCSTCGGTGGVIMTDEDYNNLQENEIIGNSEMMKDPV